MNQLNVRVNHVNEKINVDGNKLVKNMYHVDALTKQKKNAQAIRTTSETCYKITQQMLEVEKEKDIYKVVQNVIEIHELKLLLLSQLSKSSKSDTSINIINNNDNNNSHEENQKMIRDDNLKNLNKDDKGSNNDTTGYNKNHSSKTARRNSKNKKNEDSTAFIRYVDNWLQVRRNQIFEIMRLDITGFLQEMSATEARVGSSMILLGATMLLPTQSHQEEIDNNNNNNNTPNNNKISMVHSPTTQYIIEGCRSIFKLNSWESYWNWSKAVPELCRIAKAEALKPILQQGKGMNRIESLQSLSLHNSPNNDGMSLSLDSLIASHHHDKQHTSTWEVDLQCMDLIRKQVRILHRANYVCTMLDNVSHLQGIYRAIRVPAVATTVGKIKIVSVTTKESVHLDEKSTTSGTNNVNNNHNIHGHNHGSKSPTRKTNPYVVSITSGAAASTANTVQVSSAGMGTNNNGNNNNGVNTISGNNGESGNNFAITPDVVPLSEDEMDSLVNRQGLVRVVEEICARLCGTFMVENYLQMMVRPGEVWQAGMATTDTNVPNHNNVNKGKSGKIYSSVREKRRANNNHNNNTNSSSSSTFPSSKESWSPIRTVKDAVRGTGVGTRSNTISPLVSASATSSTSIPSHLKLNEKPKFKSELSLLSDKDLLELWHLCKEDLASLCDRNSNNIKSVDEMLCLKEIILITSEAMSDHGEFIRESPLSSILPLMGDAFSQLQTKELQKKSQEAFEQAGYQPLVVDSETYYRNTILALELDMIEFESDDYWGIHSDDANNFDNTSSINSTYSNNNRSNNYHNNVGGGGFSSRARIRRRRHRKNSMMTTNVATGGNTFKFKLSEAMKKGPESSTNAPVDLTKEGLAVTTKADLFSPKSTNQMKQTRRQLLEQDELLDDLEDKIYMQATSTASTEDSGSLSSTSDSGIDEINLTPISGDRRRSRSTSSFSSNRSHSARSIVSGMSSPRSSATSATASSRGSAYGYMPFMTKKYSFSAAVPAIVSQLYLTITRYFAFIVKIPSLERDFGGSGILSGIESALVGIVRAFDRDLSVDGDDTPLIKACQLSVDASAVAKSLHTVHEMLLNAMDYFGFLEEIEDQIDPVFESGAKMLETISDVGTDKAVDILTVKVDQLLESLCFIDWTGLEQPTERGPHDVVTQIVDYLNVALTSLLQLRRASVESIHMALCNRLCKQILDFMSTNQVNQIGLLCWYRWDRSVRALEAFADRCGVNQLRLCFIELREYIAAILSPELLYYSAGSQQVVDAFPSVDPRKLAILMQKTIEPESYVNIPSGVPRRQPDTVTRIIKNLKKISR